MSSTPSSSDNTSSLGASASTSSPDPSMVVIAGNEFGLFGGMRDHKIVNPAGADGKPLDPSLSQSDAEAAIYKNKDLDGALVFKGQEGNWQVLQAGIKPGGVPGHAGQEEHAVHALRENYEGFRDQKYLNEMLKAKCQHLEGHLSDVDTDGDRRPPLVETIARLQASKVQLGSDEARYFHDAIQGSLSKLTSDPFVPEPIPGSNGVHLGFACAPMCSTKPFGAGTEVAQEFLSAAEYQRRIEETYTKLEEKASAKGVKPEGVIPTEVGGGLYAGGVDRVNERLQYINGVLEKKVDRGADDKRTDDELKTEKEKLELQQSRVKAAKDAYGAAKFQNQTQNNIGATVAALSEGSTPGEAIEKASGKKDAPSHDQDVEEESVSGLKMPKGMGKKFGSDTDKDAAQQAAGEQFQPQGPVHASSHKQAGHFSVVDTDGAALNRHTNDYMQQKFSETLEKSQDYQDIDKEAKAADAAITVLQEKREAEKKKEEEDGVSEEEKKKAEAAYQETLQDLEAKKEEHEKEKRQFYEKHCQLNEQEQSELRQHLTEAINKEYPSSLEPREENGVDVYENKSGTLNCKHRDDGKVELSVPKGSKFSGVVRVPRVDANGDELEESDMIEYKNGQAVSVVAGRQGQSAVVDLDKILEQSKGHGVHVGVAEGQTQSAPTPEEEAAQAKAAKIKAQKERQEAVREEAEKKAQDPKVAAQVVEERMKEVGDKVGYPQKVSPGMKRKLIESSAKLLADAAEKGALKHTTNAGLNNFSEADREVIVAEAKKVLESKEKGKGGTIQTWADNNKVLKEADMPAIGAGKAPTDEQKAADQVKADMAKVSGELASLGAGADRSALVKDAAGYLADAAEKGALDHTNNAGLNNFSEEDRKAIVVEAKQELESKEKDKGDKLEAKLADAGKSVALQQWADDNKIMDAEHKAPVKASGKAAPADLSASAGVSKADGKEEYTVGEEQAARKIQAAVIKHAKIERGSSVVGNLTAPTVVKGVAKAKEAGIGAGSVHYR